MVNAATAAAVAPRLAAAARPWRRENSLLRIRRPRPRQLFHRGGGSTRATPTGYGAQATTSSAS
eukprot:7331830-Pyramimonas_sp.AAC.1